MSATRPHVPTQRAANPQTPRRVADHCARIASSRGFDLGNRPGHRRQRRGPRCRDVPAPELGRALLTLFVLLTLENLPTLLEQGMALSAWTLVYYVSWY